MKKIITVLAIASLLPLQAHALFPYQIRAAANKAQESSITYGQRIISIPLSRQISDNRTTTGSTERNTDPESKKEPRQVIAQCTPVEIPPVYGTMSNKEIKDLINRLIEILINRNS